MQLQGEVTVQSRVLAENTTLHEVYNSLICEFNGFTITMEEPQFTKNVKDIEGYKFYLVLQLTPSGTIDPKMIPYPSAETKEAEEITKKNIAKERLKSARNSVKTEEFTDEEVDAEVAKMDKENKGKKSFSAEDFSTHKADIKDGKIVAPEDDEVKKDKSKKDLKPVKKVKR